jgi:hypothetical protein
MHRLRNSPLWPHESRLAPAQVAEQTAEIARSTLLEIHRQGQQLGKTDEEMQAVRPQLFSPAALCCCTTFNTPAVPSACCLLQMEKDVHEASRVVRFMRRWCCFQVLCCCDCFDPDADLERTRKRRVRAYVAAAAAGSGLPMYFLLISAA